MLDGSNVGSRNSSGHQIDDSHDGGPITYVLSVLRLTFDTGPYVVFLHRERMAIAMIEPHFAVDALANHIVSHGIIFVPYLRLEDYVKDLNSLVAREYGVTPMHRFALAYLH